MKVVPVAIGALAPTNETSASLIWRGPIGRRQEPFRTQRGTPASLGDAGVPSGRSRMGVSDRRHS